MKQRLRNCLLIASLAVLTWTTTSEACHRRRAYAYDSCGCSGYANQGYTYASPAGYYGAGNEYGMTNGGYYGGGYPATYGGGYGMTNAGYYGGTYPATYGGYGNGGYGYGGYGYGRSGYYNPGGLGGPYSGLGVRPGLGLGGLGRGR
jgi:hypothetical protein